MSAPAEHARADGTSAFDAQDAPNRALIATCVHCGFCLPSCPTYALWGEEMDSPRGRIYLMGAGVDGRVAMTAPFVRHFDACLGCMACVTACPSGVQYAPLIEATRGQIQRRHTRPVVDRLFRAVLFAILPYPARVRLALAPLALWRSVWGHRTQNQGTSDAESRIPGSDAARRRSSSDTAAASSVAAAPGSDRTTPGSDPRPQGTSPESSARTSVPLPATSAPATLTSDPLTRPRLLDRIRAILSLAPRVTIRSLFADIAERTPARGDRRLTVGVLTGCVQRVVFPQVNAATVNVLAAEGCDVVAPRAQGCCGALSLHAGRIDEARAFARLTIDAFERAGVDRVAVNAAGCGSAMKEYGQLLSVDPAWADRARAFSARVRDVTEILAELGEPRARRHPLALKIAYHDACHLAHAQGVRQPPRDLLRSIPGVELVAFAEQDMCCGSAGIYNLVEPDAAAALGDRKVARVADAGADVVASANAGCTLQMEAAARRRGRALTIRHPIELLDASIRNASVSRLA